MSENTSLLDIEFRSASKHYGSVVALENFDLSVEQGTFLSILGPSGSGKTTSLRLLAGFEQPTSGDIYIRGQQVTEVPAYHRSVNMVFQHYALFPHMTVAQNIAYGLRNQRPKLEEAEIKRRVGEALELVQLPTFGNRKIFQMSGGQQQRVALARALVNRPSVLLLDEPLAALDRKLREDMQHELQALQRELGITFVLVTHDQEEAMSMSDVVCLMNQGRIVQKGSAQELYDRPANAFVAGFVGKSNLFTSAVTAFDEVSASLTIDGLGGLRGYRTAPDQSLRLGDALTLSIRPEVVSVNPVTAKQDANLDVELEGRVVNRIFLGDQTEYRIQHPALGNVLARQSRHISTQKNGETAPYAENDVVRFGWKAKDVLAIA